MSRITFDLEQDEQLAISPILANPNQVSLAELAQDESDRIQRTSQSAASLLPAIAQPQFHAQLAAEKISAVPEIATKVATAVGHTTPSPELNALMAEFEANHQRLADQAIPLPAFEDPNGLFAPNETESEKRSYLIQINDLVADIMKLISKLNDRERQKTDHLKKQYGLLNNDVGGAIASRGKANFWSNVGALLTRVGGSILGAVFKSDALSRSLDALGQQIPGLTGILATEYEVKQAKSSNQLSLLSNDLQSTAQKTGDNNGWKNELTQALNEIKQLMTAAARGQ